MGLIEKRQFLFGMDFDSEERLVEPGFSRKNLNVRVGSSQSDGVGTAENCEGNTIIPNIELPSGNNKVIGAYWYKKKDLNYHFVWNENGDHGIYEYNHVSSKIVTVLQGSVLNFQQDSLITGINVVEFDDSSDLLYWVDKANPPRKINIQKAKSGGYTLPISEEVIDAIKYPPLCAPEAEFENDDTQLVNYLNDQIWQFKAAYVYDDSEVSAWSPISVQILPNTNCLATDGSNSNIIKITVAPGGELVTRLKIAGREGNINDFIQVIDQDITDYETDPDGNYIYYFRNDKVYTTIDLPQSNKLFDALPQVAGAQEFVKNKITYADVTEGYDNVDVDLELGVSYEEEVSTNTNTISGYLRISQNEATNSDYINFQPIHSFQGVKYFGGFGPFNGNAVQSDAFEGDDLDTSYRQILPLGGFTLYLAGTDYYTVTDQNKFSTSNTFSFQDEKGVFSSSTLAKRKEIRKEIEGSSSGGPGGVYDSTRVWSNWEFKDIPDGTYILRVASHETTEQDLLDPQRGYQHTSTFLNRIGFGPSSGSSQFNQKELEVTVSGGQLLDNIEIVIADLSSPYNFRNATNLAGYMVDPEDTSFSTSTREEVLSKKRVEKAALTFLGGGFGPDSIRTDHNGFFFSNKSNFIRVESYKSGLYTDSDTANIKGYDLRVSGSQSPQSPFNGDNNSTKFFAIANSIQNITDFARTNVLIKILDSTGNGVSGVRVITTDGDTQTTDATGEANMIIYAPGSSQNRDADFRFYTPAACDASFSPEFVNYNDFIGINNDNNFDTIEPDPVVITLSDISNQGRLKNGGAYEVGVVYYDRANRSGATNSPKELLLPFYNGGSSPVTTAPIVSWEIKSLAPSWATHYQLVRTKDTAVNEYIQWYSDTIEYKDSQGNLSNFNDGTIIEIDINSITDEYKTANPDSVLVYDFIEGDRFRPIKDSGNNFYQEYLDFKVLSFDAGILQVKNEDTSIDLSGGLLFEIYTPKLEEDQDIFYEIGECFEIASVIDSQGDTIYYHKGLTQDQDPFNPSGTPATGVLQGGDTYYRNRNIVGPNGVFRTSIDSQLFSDFWQSKNSDIGRPNLVDKDAKRVTRPTTIFHSDNFVPETNINGLNSFFPNYFQTYDRHYGTIKKLFEVNGRLDVYHELKVARVFVEESIVYNQEGSGNIGIANEILSYPSQVYAGEYGTMNPESFTENEGRRYFFDVRNGAVIRLANDGMTPISDKRMHSYFESKSNFYSAFDQVPEIWGTYDENFDEYVITFGSISRPEGFTPDDLALVSSQAESVTEEINGLEYTFFIGYSENTDGVPTEFEIVRDVANGTYEIVSRAGNITLGRQELLTIPAETLGFSERTGHWTSFYDFTPECMSRVGIDFLTFRNGRCYLHNSNPVRNQFYGLNFPSEVWAVFNTNPNNVKVFNALGVESDTIWTVREMLTLKGQKSSLIPQDFQQDNGQGLVFDAKEGIHYAAILKDENTPNVDIPIIEGDDMRDQSILIKLENESTDIERLFAAHVNYSFSFRSNK